MTKSEHALLLSLFSFDNILTDNQKIKKIYTLSNQAEKHYQKLYILKSDGSKRTIYNPDYYLKNIQKSILSKILVLDTPSIYAFAYRKGVNLKDNALIHVAKNVIIKLDIHHFFESISTVDIYNLFHQMGYSNSVSGLLANLCTYFEFLPQGAPTSPYLSNLILKDFDIELGSWCKEKGINYTRYSDDMTFSMDNYNPEIIQKVRDMLSKKGFYLNNKKIHVINNYAKQSVTGIVVNKKANTDILYRKKIRQNMYYIKKFGIDSHLEYINETNKIIYCRKLLGEIQFVLQIDNNNLAFVNYKKYIQTLIENIK
jgi:RNA-directed DNA polymerase